MDDKFIVIMLVVSVIPMWLLIITPDLVNLCRALTDRARAEARLAEMLAGKQAEPMSLTLCQEE